MAKSTRKRHPAVLAAARVIGGALAKKGAKAAAKRVVKSKAKKSAAKKAVTKKKASPNSLEKTLRSENKGDARVKGAIERLRKQEQSGLISAGERHRALNRMTKANKAAKARPSVKMGGIKRDVRRSGK